MPGLWNAEDLPVQVHDIEVPLLVPAKRRDRIGTTFRQTLHALDVDAEQLAQQVVSDVFAVPTAWRVARTGVVGAATVSCRDVEESIAAKAGKRTSSSKPRSLERSPLR